MWITTKKDGKMSTIFMKDPPAPNETLKEVLFNQYGLTLEKAAKMLGISPTSLENYISGKRKISFDLAYRLDLAELGSAHSWLILQPSYEMAHFVYSLRKKPKVATKEFQRICKQKQKEAELENMEVDKLIERKLLKMELEEQELAQRKQAERAERKRAKEIVKEIADEKRTAQRSHSRATVHHQPAI